ncbi:MAG: aldo/keto reductase [Thermodesulfobacteriota bacterium]|jgi:predicted aldo/keto reductase-like oxidoreductase
MAEIRIEKVRLGRTDLIVTRLGWGGIPIQRVGEEEAVSVIRAVIEMGVDLLDTARAYTNSEHRIGLALQEINKPIVLSTRSTERSDKIYNDVHESLKQLNVKKIDIYHLHNVSNFAEYEKVLGAGGAYKGLKQARDEGLIGHIGITSHSLQVLEKAIEDGHFEVVMACYSFLEPEAANKVFPLAKAKDVGVLVMKAFSGGVIEEAGPALRFVLQTKEIVAIPGSETLERAQENWKVFTEGGSLTEKDQERIEAIKKQLNQQFCRRCDYCQPCSEGINIQFAVGLKSIIKRYGPMAQELKWMPDLIKKARNCSECGDCLTRCPYQLPIPELIRENLAWYDNLKSQ